MKMWKVRCHSTTHNLSTRGHLPIYCESKKTTLPYYHSKDSNLHITMCNYGCVSQRKTIIGQYIEFLNYTVSVWKILYRSASSILHEYKKGTWISKLIFTAGFLINDSCIPLIEDRFIAHADSLSWPTWPVATPNGTEPLWVLFISLIIPAAASHNVFLSKKDTNFCRYEGTFKVSFLSVCQGDGHYRAAGSHVFHQLLEEVSQHHMWASPDWSAAKCR